MRKHNHFRLVVKINVNIADCPWAMTALLAMIL